MAAWPVTLALCCLTSVCWSASLVVPVSRAPIQEQKEQQLGPFEIGPAVTEANVSAGMTTTRATMTTTTTVIKSRLVPNILSSTISTTSDETLIDSTTVSATLNDTEGVAASPTLLPHSTTSSEETTTFRFDAESSAESFESAESTSATGSADLEAPPATKPPSVNTGEPINQVAGPSTTGKSSGSQLLLPPSLSWPWMVFVLNGNATVATRRQRDLGTYLRLNLAARLDADYNDVAINRILLTPQAILANISVEPSHLVYGGTGAAGLEALGQGNVTLLELSGHEFQVDRIIRFDEIVDQRGMMSSLEMSSLTATVSSEVTVYGAVGAVFLFLLVALLLGLSFSSPCKAGDNGKYLPSNNLGYDRDQMDYFGDGMAEWKSLSTAATTLTPPVIYTEQLAREMGDGLLTRSHFIPSSRPSPTSTTTTLAELHNHHRCHQEGRQS